MKLNRWPIPLAVILWYGWLLSLWGADPVIEPVTPNASPEARALLELLHRTAGKYVFTGQHNYPNTKDRNSQFAARYAGKRPAIWSTDWGFAKEGDTDSCLARPDIVQEAKRQHQMGSLVTICWHAVPPTADEPVTFRPQRGAASNALASVQGRLRDEQFKDVLTPGTELHRRWLAQVDAIAVHLKELQKARVPILWRPYHEMNGDWFWWGGLQGKYSTQALYRQLFDRLAKHHQLNNLVWVWSVDRPNKPEMQFSNYYPGDKYLDVLALDVYGSDFKQSYYDELVALSKGKPVVLGEVGSPPGLEILNSQPRWGYWVVWAGMARNTSKKQYQTLLQDPRILSQDDPVYWETMAPFRQACGLSPLPVEARPVDFSGTWILNEERCVLDNFWTGNLPYKMAITHKENSLSVRRHFVVEWGDDRIAEETSSLDGKEIRSEFFNSPRVTTMKWSADGDALIVESRVTFNRGGQTSEMVTKETWSVRERGRILSIQQSSNSFRGERKITLIFEKQ
jgi:mannan endo-1,4-beta-mannosidase